MPVSTFSQAGRPDRHQTSRLYGDELSLFDLWNILVRHRWWVLGVWLLMLLAAVVYLSVAQPIFESRAVAQVGRVGGEPIASISTLLLELRERYRIGEPNRERPYLKGVKREGDDALVLEAEAESAIEAQQFLGQVMQTLLTEQERLYDENRALHEAALDVIERQIADLNEQLGQLAAMEGSHIDEAVKALMVLQRSSLQTDLPTLHQRRFQLQQGLSSLKSYPTQAVREPILAERVSKPRSTLVLAMALVLGGMLGCVVAFFVSFLQEGRKRTNGNSA